VTVTVTELGLGATAGAVYVAVVAVEPPPADCVVKIVNVPHAGPVHPAPLSAHTRMLVGFDPATGVSMATRFPVPLTGTAEGPDNVSEKLLVTAMFADICLEGSATLVAVSVTFAGAGRIGGAV
jgi:hypothetical protein